MLTRCLPTWLERRPWARQALTCHDGLLRGQLSHKQLFPLQQGPKKAAACAHRVLDLLLVLRLRGEADRRAPRHAEGCGPARFLHGDSSPTAPPPRSRRDPPPGSPARREKTPGTVPNPALEGVPASARRTHRARPTAARPTCSTARMSNTALASPRLASTASSRRPSARRASPRPSGSMPQPHANPWHSTPPPGAPLTSPLRAGSRLTAPAPPPPSSRRAGRQQRGAGAACGRRHGALPRRAVHGARGGRGGGRGGRPCPRAARAAAVPGPGAAAAAAATGAGGDHAGRGVDGEAAAAAPQAAEASEQRDAGEQEAESGRRGRRRRWARGAGRARPWDQVRVGLTRRPCLACARRQQRGGAGGRQRGRRGCGAGGGPRRTAARRGAWAPSTGLGAGGVREEQGAEGERPPWDLFGGGARAGLGAEAAGLEAVNPRGPGRSWGLAPAPPGRWHVSVSK